MSEIFLTGPDDPPAISLGEALATVSQQARRIHALEKELEGVKVKRMHLEMALTAREDELLVRQNALKEARSILIHVHSWHYRTAATEYGDKIQSMIATINSVLGESK